MSVYLFLKDSLRAIKLQYTKNSSQNILLYWFVNLKKIFLFIRFGIDLIKFKQANCPWKIINFNYGFNLSIKFSLSYLMLCLEINIYIRYLFFIIYQNRYNHEESPEENTSQIKIHASYKSIEARLLFHIVEIFVFIKKKEIWRNNIF